jgi:general secretion pathway protein C
LTLFEETELDSQAAAPPPRAASRPVTRPAPGIDKRQDQEATALARSYRERLYQNPQSLAEVVSVAAVRQDGQLRGYRISPGKDVEQFARLGFKKGDLITGVNGIALNDPANTMKLYQAMRSADEAVFELERDDQQFTINVSLDDTGQ